MIAKYNVETNSECVEDADSESVGCDEQHATVVVFNDIQRSLIQTVMTLRKSMYISAWLTSIGFMSISCLWYYTAIEVQTSPTLYSWILFGILLVNGSTASNTIVSYLTIFHGKMTQSLQVVVDSDTSDKDCRGHFLFLENLCTGSYTVCFALFSTLSIVVFMHILKYAYAISNYNIFFSVLSLSVIITSAIIMLREKNNITKKLKKISN